MPVLTTTFLRDDAGQPEDGRTVSMLVVGQQIEHTAGPTWQQRVRIAAVLAGGLPLAIGAAYLTARTVTALAVWVGAMFA